MKSNSHGTSAPKFVVISDLLGATVYTGSREKLIALGFARPEQFPDGTRRVKSDYSMDNIVDEGWRTKRIKGGLFQLKKSHALRAPKSPVALEKFELNYRPDLDGKYAWELLQGRWSALDEQSLEEISDVIDDIVEVVENAQARAKKNHLKLIKSPPSATHLSATQQLNQTGQEVQRG